jgi:hypothetical protein
MDFIAVDARTNGANSQFVGCAIADDNGAIWSKSWTDTRDILARHAETGHILVAHGAEEAGHILFLARRESYRATYHNDKWSHGTWYPSSEARPMAMWCSWRLSGGLSIVELSRSLHTEMNSPPSIIRKPIGDEYEHVCFVHNQRFCAECWGKPDHWAWTCVTHGRGECLECWQTQAARTVYEYMWAYRDLLARYHVEPRRTISSAAVQLWRRIDNPDPVWLRDMSSDRLARHGYYGGRCEVYKYGRIADVRYADISMMYASVMRDIALPNPRYTTRLSSRHLDDRWIAYEGVSDVTVTIPDMYVPPLPVRVGDELHYPIGTVRTVATHVELRAAIARGCEIQAVHETVYSTELISPMSSYIGGMIDYRQELRRQGSGLELVAKLLINGLYGRLGLRYDHTDMQVFPLPPGMSDANFPMHECRILRDVVLLRTESERQYRDKWANPLWAALIAGHARVRLMRYMEMQGSSLVYVDTDSIMSTCDIEGLGEGVGELEYEDTYEDALIVAPKMYSLEGGKHGNRQAASGVPRRVAREYVRRQRTHWQATTTMLEAWDSGEYPGSLRVVYADRRLMPTRRHVLDVQSVMRDESWSDTIPITFN